MVHYMLRRRYVVPRGERVRDYHRKDLTPSDFLFSCDYDNDDEEVVDCGR